MSIMENIFNRDMNLTFMYTNAIFWCVTDAESVALFTALGFLTSFVRDCSTNLWLSDGFNLSAVDKSSPSNPATTFFIARDSW